MKANETSLIELIGVRKRVFSIPVYQRNYDWRAEHCKQLFFDIKTIAITGREHFLGTIVYIPDRSTATCPIFIIIDGQQRITSVMLFIKALHDVMEDENIRADIEEDYLKNSKGGNEYRLKLKPIESDQNVYEKIMINPDFEPDLFSSTEKQTSIFRNYELFRNLILESGVAPDKLYEAVFKLEIVEIQLDKENPQEIFESLNSTGLDLSNADLLRNYLLMSLSYEKQYDLYKRYWLSIEQMLGGDQIEPFMIHYLILKKKSDSVSIDGKRAHINSVNLYRAYKLYLAGEIRNDEIELEKLLADMKKYASYYQHFVIFDDGDQFADDHKEIFTHFNSPTVAIPLMYFYDLFSAGDIKSEEYKEMLKICLSFLFRSRVAGHNVSTQFCALLIQYYERSKKEKFIDRVWEAFNSGKGRYDFPSDEMFKYDLQTKDLYLTLRAAGVRYLLYKLEGYLSKEVVTMENATIEHIMPQTLNEKWRSYLMMQMDGSYDLYLHRLGNLTLTKENSKLSNNLFADKVREYAESNYKLTRQLSKYKEWTSKEIQSRSVRLSELATEIWPLIREYNDVKKEQKTRSGIILSLDDDFELFNGTKPSQVLFFDESISVSNWTDVYYAVHKRLYKLEKNVYTNFLKTDDNAREQIVSYDENEYKKTIPFVDGLYLNTSFRNVKRMMKKLRIFIDYFMEAYQGENGDIIEELLFEIV